MKYLMLILPMFLMGCGARPQYKCVDGILYYNPGILGGSGAYVITTDELKCVPE